MGKDLDITEDMDLFPHSQVQPIKSSLLSKNVLSRCGMKTYYLSEFHVVCITLCRSGKKPYHLLPGIISCD